MIAGLLAFFSPKGWGVVGAVVLLLGIQTARLGNAKHDLAAARLVLKDPASGKTWQSEATAFQTDLSTCRGNTTTLQSALDDQNTKYAALQADSASRLSKVAEGLKAAQAAQKSALAASSVIMASPPKGAGVCARVLDVDGKLLGSLH